MQQHPYFERIDAERAAARQAGQRNREARAVADSRIEKRLKTVRNIAFACIVAGAALVMPSFRDLRTPLEERYIFPFTPNDCAPGWDGPKVDPIKLSRGMRAILEPLVIDYNQISSRPRNLDITSPEYERESAVGYLLRRLESPNLAGGTVELLDETVEVACTAPDGSYRASPQMLAALPIMEDAGYNVGLQTGTVTLPPK